MLLISLAHLPIVVLLGLAWWTIYRSGERPGVLRFVWARAVRDASAEALPFSQLGGYAIGARALSLAGADATAAGASTFLDLILEFAAKFPYILLGLALLADFRSDRVCGCGGDCRLPLHSAGVAVSAKAATAAHQHPFLPALASDCAPCGAGRPWRWAG